MDLCAKAAMWAQAGLLLQDVVCRQLQLELVTCSEGITACEKATQWLQALQVGATNFIQPKSGVGGEGCGRPIEADKGILADHTDGIFHPFHLVTIPASQPAIERPATGNYFFDCRNDTSNRNAPRSEKERDEVK